MSHLPGSQLIGGSSSDTRRGDVRHGSSRSLHRLHEEDGNSRGLNLKEIRSNTPRRDLSVAFGVWNRRSVGMSFMTILGGFMLGLEHQFPYQCQAQELSATFEVYEDQAKGYRLAKPCRFEHIRKAGADAYFRDPENHGFAIGVTILPVSISSLQNFRTLQESGERLLNAERGKESTINVTMLSEKEYDVDNVDYYYFEYELESTRGTKKIASTVSIFNKNLWIVNGTIPCNKADCNASSEDMNLLREATQSLRVVEQNGDLNPINHKP